MKQDTYPISLVAESVNMLTHWKCGTSHQCTRTPCNPHNHRNGRAPQVDFLQGSGAGNVAPTPGHDGVLSPHITCFRCQKMGHYASVCPDVSRYADELEPVSGFPR